MLHHIGFGVVDENVAQRISQPGADLHAERPDSGSLAHIPSRGAARNRADKREIGAVCDRGDERAPDPPGAACEDDAGRHAKIDTATSDPASVSITKGGAANYAEQGAAP